MDLAYELDQCIYDDAVADLLDAEMLLAGALHRDVGFPFDVWVIAAGEYILDYAAEATVDARGVGIDW